jgi:uncharacterized Ntn-hydrolase superfamily protein
MFVHPKNKSPPKRSHKSPMTFSIIAYDPDTDSWGLAVASRITAVGSVVPHGRWNVGMIASQSLVPNLGRPLLEALAQDEPVSRIQQILEHDPYLKYRQIALIDQHGHTHYFQGHRVLPEAGYFGRDHVSAQGNMLINLEMLQAMVEAYLNHSSPDFGERLLQALAVGEEVGGDNRDNKIEYSAALLIVKPCRVPGLTSDCKVDLRIDQSPDPIADLWDLYRLVRNEQGDIYTD